MSVDEDMLDAHVAFEVQRLTGKALEADVRQEVAAVVDWLADQPLKRILPAASVARSVARVASELPRSETLISLCAEALADVQQVLADEQTTVGDLVSREDVDSLATVVGGMDTARSTMLDILAGSRVYSRLLSHVLYFGVKSYVLTENVLARNIPGASSLVRLGRRGLSSAAPRLEANVDRHLMSFVENNVADTLQESRLFLEATVDEAALREFAAEAWDATAARIVDPVDGSDASQREDLVRAVFRLVDFLVDSGRFATVVEQMVEAGLRRHEDRPTGELLTELGVHTDSITQEVVRLVRPALRRASATGFLERRIRARLETFYAQYEATKGPAKGTV